MGKAQQGKRKGGARKAGRKARRMGRKGSPISLFVRGKISGEAYFKQTKQDKIKRK